MSGWMSKSLGNVLRLEYGKPLDRAERKPDGRYPVYGANGEKDRTDKFFHAKPSIVVGRKGSAGEINLTEEKFWPLDVTYFADFDEKQYDLRFLFHLLTTLELPSLAKGVKPGINRNEVYALPVRVPERNEQQRIVAILDEAFDGIATAKSNAEKNLQNARKLFESHLDTVFSQRGDGWSEKTLSELAHCSLGKMLDKAKNKGTPQKYLRNLNVRWFEFDLSDLLEMRFTDDELDRFSVLRGDVVICEGGYPGRAAIWDEDEPIYFQKALHRVRFSVPDHAKWFLYFLFLQESGGKLKQYFTGAGIQHFTGVALARLKVPVAPLATIRKLVAGIDALTAETQRLESLYQQKLTALAELKKSLLHEAFSGRL